MERKKRGDGNVKVFEEKFIYCSEHCVYFAEKYRAV
jgi:hypothetical protein